MAKRKDYQLAATKTFAVEKDSYELLLKYAGLSSESILAKEKLIAIDPATKALLIRFANRIAAEAISIEDAGNYFASKTVEGVLQEVGSQEVRENGISGPAVSTDNAVARWDGASGDTLQNSGVIIDDLDNITGVGNLALAEYIYHTGDLDTYLHFTDDRLRVVVGGVDILDITELPAAQDTIVFNNGEADVDFRVAANAIANAFFIRGSDGFVGIGTNAPTYELDVVGDIGLNEYLYHNDDPNTYLKFEADHLHIYVGGIDIFDAIATAIIFNDGAANVDFRIEGLANANLLVLDAANNNISINALPISDDYDLGLLGDGVLCLNETATPVADANYGKVYCKNDDLLYFQDGAGAEHRVTPDGIEGDGAAGRILRMFRLRIRDATAANEIKCDTINRWNGDAIAPVDNIGKGEMVGDFSLNAGGDTVTIEVSGLSGNVLACFGALGYNSTGTDLTSNAYPSGNDIKIQFRNAVNANAQDLTLLVDVGKAVQVEMVYITDA